MGMAAVMTELPLMDAGRVCAIIVTYNPEPQLIGNIAALASQVGEIVIVDNASGAEGLQFIAEAAEHGRVSVVRNADNLGIAAALNIGVRFALDRGYPWVVTFDQDSTASEGFIAALLSAWSACPFHREVALVSPRYLDRDTGMISSYASGTSDKPFEEVVTTMTSGNLVRGEVFASTGLFEESFFMDCVDHEFCLRLRSKGFRIIEARDAVLVHSLGRMTLHSFAGKRFKVFNHTPLRRYYNARNRMLLYLRYGRRFIGWLCRDLINLCREIVGIILFEHNTWAKLSALLRGVAHGLLGRTGKYRDSI